MRDTLPISPSMYRNQYIVNKPSVTYQPLEDGRNALMASTQTLRSHVAKPTESLQFQNHLNSLQNLPRIDTTPNVHLAAKGNLGTLKHPGFEYKSTVNPSNVTSGLRGNEIALEGQMRTSAWGDNETKITSFTFHDRALNDVGLDAVQGSYRSAVASASNARELLSTHYDNQRRPLSGVIQLGMRQEWNPLDRIYANKRTMAPTNVMSPGIDTRQINFGPRRAAI